MFYLLCPDLNITWNGTPTGYISIAIHQRRPARDEAEFILRLGIPLAVTVGALMGILIARRFRRKKVMENSVIGYKVPVDKSGCRMVGPAELDDTARKLEPVEMPTDNHCLRG
ncbi:hypothetical protein AFLA_006963 [Aspergillus flavus NRRL3357]|nr:hypothetical protein AFLA_006963 [Aspergillus flavus NRRL3357]